MLLIILAFLFLVPGVLVVFAARAIVSRFKLYDKVTCDFEAEMDDQSLRQYKITKAVLNIKMIGMLFALPGIVLILITFK